jgi:hypothetical protein
MTTKIVKQQGAASRPNGDRDGKKAVALLQRIYDCDPLITEKLVEKIALSAKFGVGRRIGLAIASKGGEWFKELATAPRDRAEAAAISLQHITLHVQSLRQLADLLEQAQVRLMVALCARQDFKELDAIATEEVGTTPWFTPADKGETSHV